MTAMVAQHPALPKAESGGIRKSRRATAGGATDDCFTCTKRQVNCDRRRPYCSPCLKIDDKCSGYKTQLTWGVGVASRGKHRGLSLPVAKASPVSKDPKKAPAKSQPGATTTAAVRSIPNHDSEMPRRTHTAPVDVPTVSHAASAPMTPYGLSENDYISVSHAQQPPQMSHGGWANLQYSPEAIVYQVDGPHKYKHSPLALVTDNPASVVDSVGSVVDYISPISHQSFLREMHFIPRPPILYDGYAAHSANTSATHQTSPVPSCPPSAIVVNHTRAPASRPSLVYAPSESSSHLNSHIDTFESHLRHKVMRECANLNVHEVNTNSASTNKTGGAMWQSMSHKQEMHTPPLNEFSPPQWPATSETQASSHISQEVLAKMHFFIDYFKSTMCPAMVFIDGPNNPFRHHILELASNSQSLQHAICALAACNLRMKRKLSLSQERGELPEKFKADTGATDRASDLQLDDQTLSEEFQYRNHAVTLLNQQLYDSEKSCHDSVLATILILCHYRMVESGIDKFHTQFAGVKKILAMRLQKFGPSADSTWMEALFTYFDAISASINDREAHFVTTLDGMTPVTQVLPPGVENFVGCDRGLFKTISRLGRLKLLSQQQLTHAMDASTAAMADSARSLSPLGGTPLGHSSRISGGRIHSQSEIDGPGNYRFDRDPFAPSMGNEQLLSPTMSANGLDDTQAAMFRREWKEAHLALQNWQFDAAGVAASLPGSPLPMQVRDLGSVSEAFRYAALLYVERIAAPHMASNHSTVQNLVSQVLYYVTSIESGSSAEKFLLWPLFVAGSECISDLHQNIVRTKCRDIMTRSGYMNNLAALVVLEKLWAGELTSTDPRSSVGDRGAPMARRAPFNWTRCIRGPGVEVEWIMF